MDSSANGIVDPRFMQGRALLDAVGRSVYGVDGKENHGEVIGSRKVYCLNRVVVDRASDVYTLMAVYQTSSRALWMKLSTFGPKFFVKLEMTRQWMSSI